MLTAEQQERYSRHLLLDGFDQDRVRATAIHVVGRTRAALWAARYLAASGWGRVIVDEPAWHDELRALGPWTDLSGPAEGEIDLSSAAHEDAAVEGALAALDAVRQVLAR